MREPETDRETPIPRFALERDRPLSPREWAQEEQLRHKYPDRGKHVSAWRELLIAEPGATIRRDLDELRKR